MMSELSGEYKHEKGYSAVLYGEKSMIVCHDGKEVLHTGYRNVNTEEEIMEYLSEMPKFMEMIISI